MPFLVRRGQPYGADERRTVPPEPDPPIALAAGDVVLVHGSIAHGLADRPTTALAPFTPGVDSPPGEPTPGGDPGPTTIVLCGAYTLDRTRIRPLLSHVPQVVHLPAQVGRHSSLRAAVELLGGELDRPQPGSGAVVPALLDMLLLYILRSWLDRESRQPGATGWITALNDPSVSAALTAIHHDPAHPWTVEELGTRSGLSRAAFARRFTALVGQPPLTYVTWWRMTIAARAIRESDAPVRLVAGRAGYSSEIAFAAAFKRQHGVTPARYRRAPGHGPG